MFVGHYAVAYACQRHYQNVPLWVLFLSVQAMDLVFFVLVLIGTERMEIVPGLPWPRNMNLQFMPFSHSLASTIVASGICLVVGKLMKLPRFGLAVALAVMSHWACDWFVHRPDLPIVPGLSRKLGLGLWFTDPLILSYALEVGLLTAAYFYMRRGLHATRSRVWGDWGFAALLTMQTLTAFVIPVPASVQELAVASEVVYLFAVLIAIPVTGVGPTPKTMPTWNRSSKP